MCGFPVNPKLVAVFQPWSSSEEAAKALRKIADDLEKGVTQGAIQISSNPYLDGNWKLEEDSP